MKPRLDHVGLDVSDYQASKAFYEQALAPLGIRLIMEPVRGVGGFGADALKNHAGLREYTRGLRIFARTSDSVVFDLRRRNSRG